MMHDGATRKRNILPVAKWDLAQTVIALKSSGFRIAGSN